MIHRDIKPENVMFRNGGSPVLLDFGLTTTRKSIAIKKAGNSRPKQRQNPQRKRRKKRAFKRFLWWLLLSLMLLILLLKFFTGLSFKELWEKLYHYIYPITGPF